MNSYHVFPNAIPQNSAIYLQSLLLNFPNIENVGPFFSELETNLQGHKWQVLEVSCLGYAMYQLCRSKSKGNSYEKRKLS